MLFNLGIKKENRLSNATKKILVYHGIASENATRFNARFINLNLIEQHFKHFRNHYNVISATGFFDRKFDSSKPNICISFDDGYANNLKYLLPLIEKYEIPVSIFITAANKLKEGILWADFLDIAATVTNESVRISGVEYKKNNKGQYASSSGLSLKQMCKKTDYDFKIEMYKAFGSGVLQKIKQSKSLLDWWKPLADDEIRELAKHPLITIGSHGYYHNNLAEIDSKNACKELLDSKKYLEDVTKTSIDCIAYPDGSYNHKLMEYAESIGYKYQFAADYISKEDENNNKIIDRFTINPFISLNNQLIAIEKGHY